MKNHVPTLETCQKLKEAGFPQYTNFSYEYDTIVVTESVISTPFAMVAAPILTEILEQLPEGVSITKGRNPTESAARLWLELNTN